MLGGVASVRELRPIRATPTQPPQQGTLRNLCPESAVAISQLATRPQFALPRECWRVPSPTLAVCQAESGRGKWARTWSVDTGRKWERSDRQPQSNSLRSVARGRKGRNEQGGDSRPGRGGERGRLIRPHSERWPGAADPNEREFVRLAVTGRVPYAAELPAGADPAEGPRTRLLGRRLRRS